MHSLRAHSISFCSLLIALGLHSCGSITTPDQATPGPITVEWIYGPEGSSIDATPMHHWRRDGLALLWDSTKAEPGFELLDPVTGARNNLGNREQALSSLNKLVAGNNDAWRWPDELDADGEQGLYNLGGDLFVLDLPTSSFHRLTETDVEEKSASFSPDATLVAFVRNNDMFVIDAHGGNEQRLTRDGSDTLLNGTLSWLYWEEIFGRHDAGYWWSDDSQSIAYLQSDESQVGEAHFVHFDKPYPEVITQRYPKAGTTNPSVRVGVVNTQGDNTIWVDLPQEHEYVARVNWLPDNDRLMVQTMTRDQRRLDLVIADAMSGSSRNILTETDEGWVNINDDFYPLQDGKHFLWVSERSGYSHIYLYTLQGKLVRQVTKGDWAIASSGGSVFWLRQAVSAIDEADGWIYYTGLEDSSIERHLYRIRFDGTGRERVTSRPGTHAISFSPDAKHYFDTFSTIGHIPSLSIVSADGTLRRELQSGESDRSTTLDLQVPEFMEVTARDGQTLPAWILKPRDFDPSRRYPLILYVYGGPSAPIVANGWDSRILFDQVLLEAGYLVARCENRSSTAISKKLENATYLRLIGDVERDDYLDAARAFKALPYVDDDRLGIWGWSGGASMTLLMLTRSQEFKAGISIAPVTNWLNYDTKWAEFTMKRPEDNPRGYEHTNLVRYAKDLHGRLLLVHGTHDDNVHPQNSWQFIDALVDAGIAFDMMMYPMRKHGIADRAARIHLFEKMVEFWKMHL